MRLHRFFIPEEIGDKKEVVVSDRELIHQWKDVFRFTTGTRLVIFDDSGFEYLALVARLGFAEARLHILKKENKEKLTAPRVAILAALLKKDNFEWVIEKITELGVSEIVPLITDRSEKKGLNMERAKKIIKEASEQSGRVRLVKIHEPISLETAISSTQSAIALDPSGKLKIKGLSIKPGTEEDARVFIGPEGGWSSRELELFRLKNIPIYNLGSQILRAETAAAAVSALLLIS